jgi:hypothetical protein
MKKSLFVLFAACKLYSCECEESSDDRMMIGRIYIQPQQLVIIKNAIFVTVEDQWVQIPGIYVDQRGLYFNQEEPADNGVALASNEE